METAYPESQSQSKMHISPRQDFQHTFLPIPLPADLSGNGVTHTNTRTQFSYYLDHSDLQQTPGSGMCDLASGDYQLIRIEGERERAMAFVMQWENSQAAPSKFISIVSSHGQTYRVFKMRRKKSCVSHVDS